MKRYGVFMPIFKLVPALINCPAKGSHISQNVRDKKMPFTGKKSFHFGKEQDVLFAANFVFCSTQPLALPEGFFLSEVGKNESRHEPSVAFI